MKIIGIDTGATGAICEIDVNEKVAKWSPLLYREDGMLDTRSLKKLFDFGGAHYIYIEQVKGVQIFGASNNFAFGGYFARAHQMIEDYPHELVVPKKWQKPIHGGAIEKITAKEKSKQAFRKLNPNFGPLTKGFEGLIDAYLIAHYAGLKNNVTMPWGVNFIKISLDSCD